MSARAEEQFSRNYVTTTNQLKHGFGLVPHGNEAEKKLIDQ